MSDSMVQVRSVTKEYVRGNLFMQALRAAARLMMDEIISRAPVGDARFDPHAGRLVSNLRVAVSKKAGGIHGRVVVNTAGDSVVADFASAVDAVQCAVAVQAATAIENAGAGTDEAMQFRIGVHVGDVLVDGENLIGDGDNIAARLEGLAEPGGVLLRAAEDLEVGGPLGMADRASRQEGAAQQRGEWTGWSHRRHGWGYLRRVLALSIVRAFPSCR